MSTNYDTDTIEIFASQFVGNWKEFPDYVWHDEPDECSSDWGIFYTKSEGEPNSVRTVNHEVIAEYLNQYYNVDVFEQRDVHWACGIQYGFAVRVYNPDRTYTDAFRELFDLCNRMNNYPVLDEERLSELECDEMLDAWAEYGRKEFRDTLNNALFFLDDEALSQVSMDFSSLSDAVVDELVFIPGFSDCWEHKGYAVDFNYESIIDRINGLGIDWIIDTCFADLAFFTEKHTGKLF